MTMPGRAVWIETRLGLARPDGEKWVRARPMTLAEAAVQLAEDAARSVDASAAALREFLLIASTPEGDRSGTPGTDGPVFGLKLHRVISGAGVA